MSPNKKTQSPPLNLSSEAEGRGFAVEVPLDLNEVADERDYTAKDYETTRLEGGIKMAWGMMGLIVVALIFVGVYALATFPGDEIKVLTRSGEADPLTIQSQLRGDWTASVKDLLQLLVVSLLVPLLASLLGFIFGRQSENQS